MEKPLAEGKKIEFLASRVRQEWLVECFSTVYARNFIFPYMCNNLSNRLTSLVWSQKTSSIEKKIEPLFCGRPVWPMSEVYGNTAWFDRTLWHTIFLCKLLEFEKLPFLVNLDPQQFYSKIPAGNHMFKFNNRNTRTRCETCSMSPMAFWSFYC